MFAFVCKNNLLGTTINKGMYQLIFCFSIFKSLPWITRQLTFFEDKSQGSCQTLVFGGVVND